MAYEQVWTLIVILAFALVGVRHFYRERFRLQQFASRRQLIHEERMAALERGVPFHEMPPDLIDEVPEIIPLLERQAEWVERSALGLALVLTFGGVGWVIGFSLVPVTEQTLGMREMAAIGLIPTMIGIGLLLFCYLVRRERRGR